MGNMITAVAAAKSTSSGSSAYSLIFIVLIFGGLMLFMLRSSRRRQQNAQNVQRSVVNGSRIRTVHGMYGTVVDGDDRNVLVEVAPGVKVKMLRQAIATVVPDDEPDGLLHTMSDPTDSVPEPNHSEPSTDSAEQRSDISR